MDLSPEKAFSRKRVSKSYREREREREGGLEEAVS